GQRNLDNELGFHLPRRKCRGERRPIGYSCWGAAVQPGQSDLTRSCIRATAIRVPRGTPRSICEELTLEAKLPSRLEPLGSSRARPRRREQFPLQKIPCRFHGITLCKHLDGHRDGELHG